MKKALQKGDKKRIRTLGVICFWLCLWQAAALIADNSLLFAGPAAVLQTLVREAVTVSFWQTVAVSLLRIMAGFLSACVIGSILGAFAYRYPFMEELLSPFMLFCKAVPVASFAVILLIWWGAGWLSVAVCFLVVLPVVYVSLLEGLQSCDAKLLEMAAVFDMPFFNRLFYIYRPAVSPFAESCLKTALGMGIKAGVAAEVIGIANLSIGGELYRSKIYLDTAGVFAWTAVVIVLSFLLEKGVLWLWKAFCKWKPKPRAGRRLPGSEKELQPAGIVLDGAGKSFGNHKVFSGLTKRFEEGGMYCIMAPSGSGKTTLLHMMADLIQPDAGSVIRGRQSHVSLVFQEERFCEEETALRNVEMVSRDRKTAESCLCALLPQEALHKPVKNLSGGMRRRVSLARALAADSDVLLLDEPFTGLDEENRDRAAEAVKRFQNGRTVIAATHETEDADRLDGEIWRIG